jgi:hypothetical protein
MSERNVLNALPLRASTDVMRALSMTLAVALIVDCIFACL